MHRNRGPACTGIAARHGPESADEGFEEAVLTALEHLTKRRGEDYMAFVERAARDPIARRVKIADLEDNMRLTRMAVVQAKDFERLDRYHRAWTYLRGLPGTGTR